MATLHVVSRAESLAQCLEVATPQDTVLLAGAALCHAGSPAHPGLIALAEQLTGVQAREIEATGARTIDYGAFVRLVAEHQPIVSWS